MAPNGGGLPTGELADQINTDFGSFEAFKKEMSAKSAAVKGIKNFKIDLYNLSIRNLLQIICNFTLPLF